MYVDQEVDTQINLDLEIDLQVNLEIGNQMIWANQMRLTKSILFSMRLSDNTT